MGDTKLIALQATRRCDGEVAEPLSIDAASDIATPKNWQMKFVTAGAWVGAARVLGVVLTFVSNVALARLLTPVDFGEFLLVASAIGVLSTIAMFGLNSVMVRVVGESVGRIDRQSVRCLFRHISALAIPSICLVGLLSPDALRCLFPDLDWTATLSCNIDSHYACCAQQIMAEGLRGFHDQRWASLLSGGQISGPLTSLLLITFVSLLACSGRLTLQSVLWLMDLALFITAVIAAYCLRRVAFRWFRSAENGGEPVNPRNMLWRDIIWVAAPLMLMQVLMFVTTQSDVWIAGLCFNSDSVALYGVARRVAATVGMLPQIAGVAVCAPIATLNAQGDHEQMQALLRTSATFAALPSLIACLFLIVNGGHVLEVCFGQFYGQAAGSLAILLLGQAVIALFGSCGYVLIMTGHQNTALLINAVSMGLLLTIGPWAAEHHGLTGLSCVSSIVLALQTLFTWCSARWLVGVWTHAQWRGIFLFKERMAIASLE